MNPIVAWIVWLGIVGRGSVEARPHVVIETELGDIKIKIYQDDAPVTAANFLKYVDGDHFRGASLYRVVRKGNQPDNDIKIEVIQGGLGRSEHEGRLPPIEHETTDKTGVLHKDGVISMARLAPGTASSEFFICVGDQPELDLGGRRNPAGQGFAAFGKVIAGMDVVRKIHQEPADGQSLASPIGITAVLKVD